MNVLIVANTTWYIFNFRSRLISTLIDKDYTVTVLAPQDEYVTRIVALGAKHKHLQLNNSGKNPIREFVSLARMIIFLCRKRPMLILTFTPKINIYISIGARLLNIPVVANISGLGSGFASEGLLKSIMLMLYRMTLGYPNNVFFQNRDDLEVFINSGLVRSEKTDLLPGSGVNLDRFTPCKRTSRRRFIFLLVARLLWDKGVNEFVEAARLLLPKHQETAFHLLGFLDVQNPSAISRTEIERWESEGVISYLGSTDDVRPYYAEADCVVLPSYYREGVPRTLLEAAAMECPIITTDTTGCRDTVEDSKTGFLCRPRNVSDLAEKMERMLNLTPEQRAAMGKAGRAKMEKEFDERIVIDRYLQAIEEIANNHPKLSV